MPLYFSKRRYNRKFVKTQSLTVRIINKSTHPLPAYATEGSSGMDLRAFLSASLILQPGQRMLVPTGLFLEIPEGYEAQIRPRSGLAIKQGITCLNTPGTIDADYRGEIKVILINLSSEEQTIHDGDRIAQMVFQKIEKASLITVDSLNQTERSDGGFGHTGKH
ncbi:MAG: dUTP diphosphatase [Chitinophagia bacterium]|jgi:dUTP pyrophosphatase